jgi:HAMP domain-containing protein
MSDVALVLALAVAAAAVASAAIVTLLPTLRLQLGALALLIVCLPLGVVLGSGLVMFGMHEDAKILSVAIVSTLCALGGALLLGRHILRPLGRLRTASKQLAAGDLSVRASESGPRELLELSASFNEMAAGLEQLFDARRELVAWASHDLRTPLASLRAMVETLEDGLATPDEYLPAIRTQTEILSGLVEDLFDLAMIDAGALTLELRDEPLGGVVEGCLEALEPEARSQAIRLESRLDPDDPPVRVAPERSVACCSTCSRTRFAMLLRTERCQWWSSPTPTTSSLRWRTAATGSRRERRNGCSSASGATTSPGLARAAARVSAWRSRRGSFRRTAAGSGPGSADMPLCRENIRNGAAKTTPRPHRYALRVVHRFRGPAFGNDTRAGG